jgi:hypothetical protein
VDEEAKSRVDGIAMVKAGQDMRKAALLSMLLMAGATGCLRVKTDPVEVKPIHITVDVNLKVERELENFFGDIDANDPTVKADSGK